MNGGSRKKNFSSFAVSLKSEMAGLVAMEM